MQGGAAPHIVISLKSLHIPGALDPRSLQFTPLPLQIRAATRGGVYIIALHSTLASEDQVGGGGGPDSVGEREEGFSEDLSVMGGEDEALQLHS